MHTEEYAPDFAWEICAGPHGSPQASCEPLCHPILLTPEFSLSCSNQLYVSNATDFVVVEAHIRARSLVGSGWCVNLACIPTDISNCLLTSSRIFMAEL